MVLVRAWVSRLQGKHLLWVSSSQKQSARFSQGLQKHAETHSGTGNTVLGQSSAGAILIQCIQQERTAHLDRIIIPKCQHISAAFRCRSSGKGESCLLSTKYFGVLDTEILERQKLVRQGMTWRRSGPAWPCLKAAAKSRISAASQ